MADEIEQESGAVAESESSANSIANEVMAEFSKLYPDDSEGSGEALDNTSEAAQEVSDESDADAGSDSTVADIDDESETVGSAAEDQPKFTEAESMLAESVGLDADDLEQIADSKSLMATIRLLRKKGITPAKDEAVAKDDAAAETVVASDDKLVESEYEPDFDDMTVKHVKATRKLQDTVETLSQKLEEYEKRDKLRSDQAQAQEHNLFMQRFHVALDAQDNKIYGKLFDSSGKASTLSKADDKNRRDVYEQFQLLRGVAIGRSGKTGENPPTDEALIQQAQKLVHGELLAKRASEKRAADLKGQSASRRQVGSKGATTRRPEAPDYTAASIANDPEIQKFFK